MNECCKIIPTVSNTFFSLLIQKNAEKKLNIQRYNLYVHSLYNYKKEQSVENIE